MLERPYHSVQRRKLLKGCSDATVQDVMCNSFRTKDTLAKVDQLPKHKAVREALQRLQAVLSQLPWYKETNG